MFRSTRWSVVTRAGGVDPTAAREAIAWLFRTYSYPLYAYARRRGLSAHDAEEAVQDLFLDFLGRRSLVGADSTRGKFRAYLLGAFSHALGHRERAARALKRGGGRSGGRERLSLDVDEVERRYGLEPDDGGDPARLFDASWARAVLQRAFERLRDEYAARGEATVFERLRDHLVSGAEAPYTAIGDELGMSDGAVRMAAHRLRKRFRAALEAEILETVEAPAEVDDEIRYLLEALGG
jgi:RNA polymerase sigma factor (sigma-70 family)